MPDETLPAPECRYGYPITQLQLILSDRMPEFAKWFGGKTGSICDGRRYDHDKREYEPTGCGPHGLIVYAYDVESFLRRRSGR